MILFLEEIKERPQYKRGPKEKIESPAVENISQKKIGYSSLCQYANPFVILWSDQQHAVYIIFF